MLQSLVYYIKFGQAQFLLLFLIVIAIYLTWRLTTLAIEPYFFPHDRQTNTAGPVSSAVLRLLVGLLLVFTVIGIGVERVNAYPHQRADVVANNAQLMQADAALFGVYPPFWLQDSRNAFKAWFDRLGPLLLLTYNSLSMALGAMLVALAVVNPRQCARMIGMFLVSLLLSLPIWYFFPALVPLEAYLHPIIENVPSADIQAALAAYEPSNELLAFHERIVALREQGDEKFMAITTLPSMHIAWATALLFYGAVTWTPLLIFLVPYFLLNAVATMYTLEHYAVDIPAGLLVAIVSIVLVRWLRPERWPDVKTVIALLRRDMRSFGGFIASFWP